LKDAISKKGEEEAFKKKCLIKNQSAIWIVMQSNWLSIKKDYWEQNATEGLWNSPISGSY